MKNAAELLLEEAYQIADGETREIGTSAHVKAVVAELRAVSEKEHNVTMNYLIADRNLTKIVKAADRLLLVARILETVGPFNLSPETYDLAAINNLEQALLQAKGGRE